MLYDNQSFSIFISTSWAFFGIPFAILVGVINDQEVLNF